MMDVTAWARSDGDRIERTTAWTTSFSRRSF